MKEEDNTVDARFPTLYYFDINKRVYNVDNVKTNFPDYRSHFVKIRIVEETDKEFICAYNRTINKRSKLYKKYPQTRVKVFTEQEVEDAVTVNELPNKLVGIIRKLDAKSLREVEELLIKNGEL